MKTFYFVVISFVDVVDPNRDGYVSLQEYMAFMISKETENVQSSEEIENAFRAITAGDRPYVTKEELYAVSILNLFLSAPTDEQILFLCGKYSSIWKRCHLPSSISKVLGDDTS